MKSTMIIILLGLCAILAHSAPTHAFDPDATIQVSKNIAEWKLLKPNKGEPQNEPTLYVSSSLIGMVDKADGAMAIVNGLMAFDNDSSITSQMRQWELNTGAAIGSNYQLNLPSSRSAQIGMTGSTGLVLETSAYSRWGRGLAGIFKNPAIKWQTIRGSAIFSTATCLAQFPLIFFQTVDNMGTSMQIINPPIYLHTKTPWGFKGQGSYSIPGGKIYYQETLRTAGPGPITRTHTDWGKTNTGILYQHIRTSTPVTHAFERFMMHHYPLGSYYDPGKTTSTLRIINHDVFREVTTMGNTTLHPGLGSISSSARMPTYGGGIASRFPSTPIATSPANINYNPPPTVLLSIQNPLTVYNPPTTALPPSVNINIPSISIGTNR